jgi:hypothetical protein
VAQSEQAVMLVTSTTTISSKVENADSLLAMVLLAGRGQPQSPLFSRGFEAIGDSTLVIPRRELFNPSARN